MLRKINFNPTKKANQTFNLFSIYCLLGLGIISMYSCAEDQDEIIGSWTLKVMTLSNCADSSNNLTFSFDDSGCTDFQGDMLCSTAVITFREDGSFTNSGNILVNGSSVSEFDDNGTWSRNGMTVVLCETNGDCSGSTIQINGDNVTVSDGTTTSECDRRREFERT